MKAPAWHRPIWATLLFLPLIAAAPAYAEDGSHDHSDSSHHESDGHNDDGNSQGATPGTANFQPGTGQSGGSSSSWSPGGDGQHRRFGDLVSSPTLDLQQTKAAIEQGKAASMPLLLTYLNQNYPGQVLDVKLHNANDGFVYEVRYLSNAIFLRTLFLDAATLKAK